MNYAWRRFFRNAYEEPSSVLRVAASRALSHRRPQLARLIGRYGRRPEFLIIGVQKGGTTSLYSYLVAHPHVRSAFVKEVHYFDFHYACGELWYLAHFAPHRWLEVTGQITGEASPEYIFARCA